MKTLKSELKKWQKNNLPTSKKIHKKKKVKKQSEGFWKEMMGINRPKYERRGGSWRQK